MKYKTNKLKKLEKSRNSVFTSDMNLCYFCKVAKDDIHELLPGRNRINSMKYGYVLPLCRHHHNIMHDPINIDKWKIKCQSHFEKNYGSREDFISIFGRNYLK